MQNQKIQALLIGIILTIAGIVCRKAPLSFLMGYEYIKNDPNTVKRIKRLHCIVGYIFQIVGMFILSLIIVSIIYKLL